jgi:uncharacterized membrane protein
VPSAGERFAAAIKRWFTEGNVPVKVGVIVLFLGIGALLKYAADQHWLKMPIELRFAGIAASAIVALGFAWRKRDSHRLFALSLQGGAIGVLILTVFAAFQRYHLLPAGVAFVLLVVLVAGVGVLAVLQDAMALAVLGVVGGFLAPLLVSTDSGNHVALFAYYAVLNAAIFGVAWWKPWRVLNLIGFAFTFAIGTGWGVYKYQPEFFSSTEPFLILFFLFYLTLPLLYALRQPPQRRGFVDGTLVFGTPLLAFPLQAALLRGDKLELAYSALAVAVMYAGLAWLELRRIGLKLLGESHALLALGFATLAVPLALSARTTACAWALEGAALVWLGLRQERRVPRWIGYLMQTLAGAAFLVGFGGAVDAVPVLNGELLSALLIAVAGLTTARLLYVRAPAAPLPLMWFLWGLAWWCWTGAREIERFAPSELQAEWTLGFIALTGVIAAEFAARLSWRHCLAPAAAAIPLALPLVFATGPAQHGPLEGLGAAPAWLAWLGAALIVLTRARSGLPRITPWLHVVFLVVLNALLAIELGHLAADHAQLAPLWCTLLALSPVAASYWLTLRRQALLRYPLGELAEALHRVRLGLAATVLTVAAIVGLFVEGDPSPLPYLPLLNPLELAQGFVLLSLLAWYRQAQTEGSAMLPAQQRAPLLAAAGWALLTAITLRTVHFFTHTPWDESLLREIVAQASLSVVWSLAGLTAMLLGARRGSRAVWIGGAILMGVVLAKLALVDRRHLGDLAGIVSFLAVGVLLLVVGYFAPVPPRTAGERA